MADSLWKPGKEGEPLAPPGFVPKRRIIGHPDYAKDHPTRYTWARHIIPLIRKIYRQIGGPEYIHLNTYVWHPPRSPQILRNYQIYSFDVWDGKGRGWPIDPDFGHQAVDIVWNDLGEPYLWYYIWQAQIHNRFYNDFEGSPWGQDSFTWHYDHPHFTFLKPGGILP